MAVDARSGVNVLPVVHVAEVVASATWFVVGGLIVGLAAVVLMHWRGWSWTWGLPLLVTAPFTWLLGWHAGVSYQAFALAAVGGGACRHLAGVRAGGDLAQRARDRIGRR